MTGVVVSGEGFSGWSGGRKGVRDGGGGGGRGAMVGTLIELFGGARSNFGNSAAELRNARRFNCKCVRVWVSYTHYPATLPLAGYTKAVFDFVCMFMCVCLHRDPVIEKHKIRFFNHHALEKTVNSIS